MVDPSGQTFRPANAAPRTAQLAATRVLEGLRPCDVGVVIVCPATDTTGDGDTTDGAGGVSAGTVTATGGLAAILAAILSKCVAKYDEHRCTSFLVTDEHHIVAQTAARAKPARDVLIDIYPDGVDLPRGVNNRHNLVDIPRFAHYFLHNFAYYDEVNRLVLGAFSKGRGGEARSSARVVGRLDAIAQALRFAFGGGVAA